MLRRVILRLHLQPLRLLLQRADGALVCLLGGPRAPCLGPQPLRLLRGGEQAFTCLERDALLPLQRVTDGNNLQIRELEPFLGPAELGG